MITSDSTYELKRGFRFNLRSLNVQNAFRAEAGVVLLAFRVLSNLELQMPRFYSDCMSVVTRVKEIDSLINQAIKASIPSYDIWKETHNIIFTMEWDIM